MNTLIIVGGIIIVFWISCYYAIKILDWRLKRKKFENNKAEYISDLYNLQRKWSSKGEFDYARYLNEVVLFVGLPVEQPASTEYGKNLQRKLRELEEDEQEH